MSEAATYWESRAIEFGNVDGGLPAVCSYGMPILYNRMIHSLQRRALTPWLNTCRDKDVLDFGCGVGRWSLRFAKHDNRVVGIDISPRMIQLAAESANSLGLDAEFLVQDIVQFDLHRQFDLVLGVTVLQHILNTSDLRTAVHGIARHLRQGGTLLFLEVAPSVATERCDSFVFRTRGESEYLDILRDSGLKVESIRGVDISPLRPLLLPLMKHLPKPLARGLVTTSSALSFPLDLALAPRFPDACWHKLIVARRR